jgi:ketosteroid isomerase-like protein
VTTETLKRVRLDGERVLALTDYKGGGKKSGLDVGDMRTKGAHLFHVRDGKVNRSVHYWDREHSFADFGLASDAGCP